MVNITSDVLFTTSVARGYIYEYDRENLVKIILDKEKSDSSNKRSNAGGWQSFHCDNSKFDNIYVEALFNTQIMPILDSVADAWAFPKTPNLSYWYNVNRKGNYNHAHYHPGAVLSGVFYIKIPKDSGRIMFLRAASESDRMDFLTQWQVEKNITLSGGSDLNVMYEHVPEENLLLIFPGHLEHYVSQNNTPDLDDARISISFNYFL